jgi:signal transduction histidine kinase
MRRLLMAGLEWLPRPLDMVSSIKLKLAILLLGSGGTGLCVLWYGLGMMPPKTTATAAIVALVTSQMLAHGVTSPLRQMTAAAKAMAHGDYTVQVRATSRDEVGQLAAAFNQMAADLAAADRQRRELIANVSHELRTPITALHAMLENLVDGVATPGPERLAAAVAQTDRLARLVTELLDVSRLEAGHTPLDRHQFDVWTFIDETVAEATFHSGVEPVVDVPAGLTGYGDVERLHQVLANLLANAARHNPEHGTITVSARRGEAGLVFEVADEGPGIAPLDRDRVFERFTRGEPSGSDGGTGLGLAIARWVVDLHGGRIEVVDSSPGGLIRVTIPDKEPHHDRFTQP